MFFSKSPNIRRFEYTPRHSSPDRRERMKFNRKTVHQPRAGKNTLYFLLLILVFFLIYLFLNDGSIPLGKKDISISSDDVIILEDGE